MLDRVMMGNALAEPMVRARVTEEKTIGARAWWTAIGEAATVLATLPAGAGREAGQAHVRFNHTAQALASRVVRQADRRLTLVGVAHTHPSSLRHPSDGDYRGDVGWVSQLRGGEGVFA